MACDYGSKTIGIAISDPMGMIAQGIETIRRDREESINKSLDRIEALIDEYKVEKIVVGLPLNMNNTRGERVEKTQIFIEKLRKRTDIEIITWDERLSTMGANRVLMEADLSRKKRAKVIDKMAAVFILQGYLDSI